MTNPYLTIHRLVRRLQQRNRYVGESSLAESHLLVELDRRPGARASDLVQALGIEQSVLSRLIARLVKKRIILVKDDKADSRRKLLYLSAAGKDQVRGIDSTINARLESYSDNLKIDERAELLEFWRILANGLGQPTANPRKTDSPFRVEQRRITRGLGLFRKHFMGSAISPSQFHILAECVLRGSPPSIGWLSERLCVAPNAVSQAVDVLEADGYLTRKRSAGDSRSVNLFPTVRGIKTVNSIEQQATKLVSDALRSLAPYEITRFVELFQRMIAPESIDPVAARFVVQVIRDEKKTKLARAFLMQSIVRLGWQHEAPARLLDSSSMHLGVFDDKELVCVFDMTVKNRVAHILSAGFGQSVSAETYQTILDLLSGYMRSEHDAQQIAIDFPPLRQVVKSL